MRPMDVVITNAATIAASDEAESTYIEQSYKPYRGERFLCLYLGSIAYKRGGKLPNLAEMAIARLEQARWVWATEPLDEEPWDLPEQVEDKAGLVADLGRVAREHQGSPDNVLTQELLDALNAHGYLVVKDPLRAEIDNRVSQLGEA